MSRIVLVVALLFLPNVMHAATIDHIGFTTDPQTIAPATASSQITIETQDAGNVAVNGNSVCMQITSSSPTGEFSTNETSWPSTPTTALSLTLSTSQYRRNFYYRDSSAGSFTITAKAGLKPGSSCTGWDPTSATWSATQTIIVGPGSAQNSQQSQQTSTSTSSSSNSSSSSITVPSYVPPPAAEVFADGGDNRTVIVGADTVFQGRAYNRDQELVEGVRFNWNFGDGTTAEGVNVSHHFAYPGTYAVILTIAQHVSSASDRIIVTAEPAELAFVVHPDASVAITNNAGRDIDISRWIIKSFGRTFVFPDGTEILEGQTLRIPYATLGFTVGPQTELQYPNGVRAELVSETQKPPTATPQTQASVEASAPMPVRTLSIDPVSVTEEKEETEEMLVSATSTNLAAAAHATKSSYLWWLAPIAFTALASGTVFAIRRTKKGEWNVIDES